ncbi:hypothetical protein E4U42_001756, partial [Claviceps africana]
MAPGVAGSSAIPLRDTPRGSMTPPSREGDTEGDAGQAFSLPPVDRGKDAWFFLAACFFVEALTW